MSSRHAKRVPAGAKPGDWQCPNCQVMIFASKDTCFKCEYTREAGSASNEAHVKENYAGGVASAMPFSELVKVFEARKSKATGEALRRVIRSYHTNLAKAEERRVKLGQKKVSNKDNFFPIMRLLLPKLDRERSTYNLKQKSLGKLIIKVLGLPERDAAKIENWNNVEVNPNHSGNLPAIVQEVAESRIIGKAGNPNFKPITVGKVNELLDALAAGAPRMNTWQHRSRRNAAGQTEAKETDAADAAAASKVPANHKQQRVLQQFVDLVADARELRWITEEILREGKGFDVGESLVLRSFHPDAKEYYNHRFNLETVCKALSHPNDSYADLKIELFSIFSPQLAEKCEIIGKIFESAQGPKPVLVETKLDGDRCQFHMRRTSKGMEFRYFTRNGYDQTLAYEPHHARVAPMFKDLVKDCIIDGEMLLWNTKTNMVIAKGVACNDVKSMGTADPDVVQSLMAFDLVYLNGVSLLDKELIERRKGLHDIFEKLDPSVIGLVPQWECNTKEELEEVILNHYESREEGVIVKKGDSKYEPGARRHSGWWKWKAEYNDELIETIDAVVVGGYFGEGRHGKIISSYVLAAPLRSAPTVGSDASAMDVDQPRKWRIVGKVGGGFTDQQRSDLNDQFQMKWVEIDKRKVCSSRIKTEEDLAAILEPRQQFFTKLVAFDKGHFDWPNTWIDPEESIVLEITVSEIHTAKVNGQELEEISFRFPRHKSTRLDKHPFRDATTWAEVDRLRGGHKHNREGFFSDKGGRNEKKKVNKARKATRVKAASLLKTIDGVSSYFDGMSFWLTDKGTHSYDSDLEGRVRALARICAPAKPHADSRPVAELLQILATAHGATVYQGAARQSALTQSFAIAPTISFQVKQAIDSGKIDCVAKPEWLVHCLEKHAESPDMPAPLLEPHYALHYSDAWKAMMSKFYDPLSDGYTLEANPTQLAQLLGDSVHGVRDEVAEEPLTPGALAEFVHDELPELASRRIFNACTVAFYPQIGVAKTAGDVAPESSRGYFAASQAVVRGGGAVIDGSYTESTTHVVCDPKHPDFNEHVHTLNAYCRRRVLAAETVFKVMPLSWVEESNKRKRRLDDRASQIVVSSDK